MMAARVTPLNEPLNTSPTERTVAFQTDEDIRKEEEEASAKNAEQKAETVSFVSNKSNVPSDKFVLAFMTFVLVVSVTAIVLTCTVLVMMKQKDANCLRRTGTNNTTEPVLPPSDVSSLKDKIKELRGNITAIKTFMIKLQQDIHSNKGDLNDTKNNISGTKDRLSQLEIGTQDAINKIDNISQQLDASVNVVNVSFNIELASVKTAFSTKLNNTAQSLLDADSSLQSRLNVINSNLTSQIQSISKLQGPTGPPGFNGSKGNQGVQGFQGLQGDVGAQGPPGEQGNPGKPGRNGTGGVSGKKGDVGLHGDKGDTGLQGLQGPQGPQGLQGPPGAGNFSQCVYKKEPGATATPGAAAVSNSLLIEPDGKKILGASCSTNRAAEYNLSIVKSTSGASAGKYAYRCQCRGESSLFTDGSNPMQCFMHYWECPLTT